MYLLTLTSSRRWTLSTVLVKGAPFIGASMAETARGRLPAALFTVSGVCQMWCRGAAVNCLACDSLSKNAALLLETEVDLRQLACAEYMSSEHANRGGLCCLEAAGFEDLPCKKRRCALF